LNIREIKCGFYLGIIEEKDIIHEAEKFKNTLYYLAFRKPTSIYALNLFNVFAGVGYNSQPNKGFERLRLVLEQHANLDCGQLYALWEFEESLQKKEGSPPLAYLDIIEEAFSTHLNAMLAAQNKAQTAPGTPHHLQALAPFFCSVDGALAAPSEYSALVRALRAALDDAGLPAPAPAPAQPQGRRRAGFDTTDRVSPPQVIELRKLINDRKAQRPLDGIHLGGFAQTIDAVLPALPADNARVKQKFRGWKLYVDRNPQKEGEMLYAEELKQTAKNHHSILSHKKEALATTQINEKKGERAAMKGPTYVYSSVFGFRSDTRPPCELRALGGFQPNAVRGDRQDKIWTKDKSLLGKKTLKANHDMLDNWHHQASWGSDVSGYVSVAYSLPPALQFYKNQTMVSESGAPLAAGLRKAGYIYVVRAMEGVDVEATFTVGRYAECEVSVAGGIGWPDIVGWRKIKWRMAGTQEEICWDSPLFLRTDGERLPDDKRTSIVVLMSHDAQVVYERGKASA